MNLTKSNVQSEYLFSKAKRVIPGGVNSPVRAFKSVGGIPVFMQSAKGAYVYDADNNAYIDFINSWGPMILGHSHPEIVAAIKEQAEHAISFGAPTSLEIELAETIVSMVPHVDMVRLVSSGTEACMSALRLARGYTLKNKFIKFEGCYHGHADPFLVKAGSGLATFNIQHVPGVTFASAQDTLTAPFNNLEKIKELFINYPNEIAAIIVEPVAGNMGCVPPEPGFLDGLRKLCDEHQSLLIFDEVMTGFRLAPGGAQELLSVHADILCFGKVIGGGMPMGAIAGKKSIMEYFAPVGNVYQAGTLSGNPLAVTCGLATLKHLKKNPEIYQHLNQTGLHLKKEISKILTAKSIAHTINQVGSMISVHFSESRIKNYADAAACDIPLFNRFFHHMLSNGIYLPPSAFETWFISNSITSVELDKTLSSIQSFNV